MRILVVMGGLSSEKEISLKSGENVYQTLKKLYPNTEKYILYNLKDFYKKILEENYDFVFLVLHGKYGEDGTIQSFLESLNIPFSFSNSLPSMIGMNKMLTNLLLSQLTELYTNFFIPKTVYINHKDYKKYGLDFILSKIKNSFILPPFIVKPNSSGSSVALSLVKNITDLENSIKQAFQEDDYVLIQEYIDGREITVGVIQKQDEIIPLEPCELKLDQTNIFDYNLKYIKHIEHIIPPNLPETFLTYLKDISKKIFELMNFKDAVRIDYRVRENVNSLELYFLEVNTIPGFTEVSLLPQEAQKTGITFEKLIETIVNNNIINEAKKNISSFY